MQHSSSISACEFSLKVFKIKTFLSFIVMHKILPSEAIYLSWHIATGKALGRCPQIYALPSKAQMLALYYMHRKVSRCRPQCSLPPPTKKNPLALSSPKIVTGYAPSFEPSKFRSHFGANHWRRQLWAIGALGHGPLDFQTVLIFSHKL